MEGQRLCAAIVDEHRGFRPGLLTSPHAHSLSFVQERPALGRCSGWGPSLLLSSLLALWVLLGSIGIHNFAHARAAEPAASGGADVKNQGSHLDDSIPVLRDGTLAGDSPYAFEEASEPEAPEEPAPPHLLAITQVAVHVIPRLLRDRTAWCFAPEVYAAQSGGSSVLSTGPPALR